jgi:hypothetical protein
VITGNECRLRLTLKSPLQLVHTMSMLSKHSGYYRSVSSDAHLAESLDADREVTAISLALRNPEAAVFIDLRE